MGKDHECAAAAGLNHDGQELLIDGTEVAVPRAAGDGDVVVALILLERVPEHVPELGRTHEPRHLCVCVHMIVGAMRRIQGQRWSNRDKDIEGQIVCAPVLESLVR